MMLVSSMRNLLSHGSDRSDRSLRHKLFFMIVALEFFCASIVLTCLGVLLIPTLRDRTWLVWPIIVGPALFIGHLIPHLVPSMPRKAHISLRPGRSKKLKVSPAIGGLLDPVTVMARSQLAGAKAIPNKDDFCPPREQPRAEKLKWVADLLQEAMFESGTGNLSMNETVAGIIRKDFVPAAKAHFAGCVEQARDMVPEMQGRYRNVRKGHLAIFQDTLN